MLRALSARLSSPRTSLILSPRRRTTSKQLESESATGFFSSEPVSSGQVIVVDKSILDVGFATRSGSNQQGSGEDRVVALDSLLDAKQAAAQTIDNALDLSKVSYIAVFDGHGGADCAEFLTKNLHVQIAKLAFNSCVTFEDLKVHVAEAFRQADDEFFMQNPGNQSGACGAIALIYDREILVAHVGDCRVVLSCNDTTICLTKDHKPSNEDELERITSCGAKILNGRVGGVMRPTRAFGNNDIRECWGRGIIISEPEVLYVNMSLPNEPSRPDMDELLASRDPLENPDIFLLIATGGVFHVLTSDGACQVIRSDVTQGTRRAVTRLVAETGSHTMDDCSAVVARWVSTGMGSPRVLSKPFHANNNDWELEMPKY